MVLLSVKEVPESHTNKEVSLKPKTFLMYFNSILKDVVQYRVFKFSYNQLCNNRTILLGTLKDMDDSVKAALMERAGFTIF